tara:strand:- start:79 stop:186 length:108 start_codon:yes stop_codon:yes gene_type:complete
MFKTEELNELVSEYHNGSITLDEYWDKVHELKDNK